MSKFIKNSFVAFISFLLIVFILILMILWNFSNKIPDYKFLKNYKPPVSSKVYSGNGELVADFSKEKRIFVPYSSIPKTIIRDNSKKLRKPMNIYFIVMLILFPLYKGIC